MAFSLRITNIKTKASVEPVWWSTKDLKEKYSFDEEWDGAYSDFIHIIDKSELAIISHAQNAKYLNKGVYSDKDWKRINGEKNAIINDWITNGQESDSFELLIFEWESGLN